ncbi:GAF and ANTAR domain-containing protein [Arthrobacter sp. Soil782]|uniref:GAF and ANTAR domain-containing protein n=1 Tax=Arthrobacter sp. Soil782 TaxID=1736410 RepID=UPI0009EC8D25|nr:GAF and ANTAR domain-containing protein [Arthrobacter sp. Soil782]
MSISHENRDREFEDTPGSVHGDLAEQMRDLARSLHTKDGQEAVLAHMVRAAIEMIPGAEEASISVVTGRSKIESHAASDDLPRLIDALQESLQQGPCIESAFDHTTVLVTDLRKEKRWPEFSRGAADLGAASMLSFQLFVEGDNLGALNLLSRSPDVFDEESEHIGLLVAAHAAMAFSDTQKIDQLHDALASRDLIGQAKGILMERYKITAQQAFIVLSKVSSTTNVRLTTVAERLAATGDFPSGA